jgi:ATP-dependent RNA helicase RhlE
MARGLDIDDVSHVINFDTPNYPENYMHRIGRTGRAEKQGHTIAFSTEKELEAIEAIENYMELEIPLLDFPKGVVVSNDLIEEERPQILEPNNPVKRKKASVGEAFHEKKEKNKKVNQGGSYRRELSKKYKKAKTRGDKNYNRRNKKK